MGLDARGIIAIVEIVIYVPILFVGGFLAIRHGFTRKAGWIFLFILAIGTLSTTLHCPFLETDERPLCNSSYSGRDHPHPF